MVNVIIIHRVTCTGIISPLQRKVCAHAVCVLSVSIISIFEFSL